MADTAPAEQPSNVEIAVDRIARIVGFSAAIAVLYFGKSLLLPFTVAVLLSFIVAPLVRLIRRSGINRTWSALITVLLVTVLFAGLAVTIAGQVAHLASSLSKYQDNLKAKAASFQDVTSGRLTPAVEDAKKLWTQMNGSQRGKDSSAGGALRPSQGAGNQNEDGQVAVEVHQPPPTAMEIFKQVAGSMASPIETIATIFIVWIFVLLDQEGLRDRLIRVVGTNDLRRTTLAMDDAGTRLSRYFLSQFSVNASMGVLVAIGLTIIGIPSAILFGSLAAVLRFIPYVGVWFAAILAAALAAAVGPGWSGFLYTILMFVVLEALVGQVIEPLLYGHTTGLSAVSVILAAVFWAGIWGPVGLILSTPLTLCLVVLGRYVDALKFLEILLGDSPALALYQQFYQRVLAGDAEEVIAKGRLFLKDKSFIEYCDAVVMPALQAGSSDEAVGAITEAKRQVAAATLERAVVVLSGELHTAPFWRRKKAVLATLEASTTEILKARNEIQARPGLPSSGSAAVGCIGLPSVFDDIAIDIFIRALRQLKLDAKIYTIEQLRDLPKSDGLPNLSTLFFVSIDVATDASAMQVLISEARSFLPGVKLISVFHPAFFSESREVGQALTELTYEARSFDEAIRESVITEPAVPV